MTSLKKNKLQNDPFRCKFQFKNDQKNTVNSRFCSINLFTVWEVHRIEKDYMYCSSHIRLHMDDVHYIEYSLYRKLIILYSVDGDF